MSGVPRSKSGFTLMELMVVILIISILAGFIIAGIGWGRTAAFKAKSRAVMGEVEKAIELFNDQNGFYPMDGVTDPAQYSDPVNNNPQLLAAIATVDQDHFGAKSPNVQDGRIVDGWKRPLRYQLFIHYPDAPDPRADINPDSYQLWSVGPDGEDQSGSGDDLNNWGN